LAQFQRIQELMRENVPQIEPPAALGAHLMQSAASAVAVLTQRRRRLNLWIAVAAAAVLALIASNVYWLARVGGLSRENELLNARLEADESGFSLASVDSMRLARLSGDEEAFAMMMWDEQETTALLYTRNFPPLQPGRVYQLWLARDDYRISGGTFTVDDIGDGALIVRASEPIDAFERAGITEEPSGGSTDPTGDGVARGEI
jgi:hypothetical protein